MCGFRVGLTTAGSRTVVAGKLDASEGSSSWTAAGSKLSDPSAPLSAPESGKVEVNSGCAPSSAVAPGGGPSEAFVSGSPGTAGPAEGSGMSNFDWSVHFDSKSRILTSMQGFNDWVKKVLFDTTVFSHGSHWASSAAMLNVARRPDRGAVRAPHISYDFG